MPIHQLMYFLTLVSCDTTNPRTKFFPFCNLNLTITQRAKDIVSRLTLDEKISQLVNTAPAIPRLGIPSYQWWNEALHGVSFVGKGIRLNGSITGVTSFPQIILTAASFDPKLWYRISKVSNSFNPCWKFVTKCCWLK